MEAWCAAVCGIAKIAMIATTWLNSTELSHQGSPEVIYSIEKTLYVTIIIDTCHYTFVQIQRLY